MKKIILLTLTSSLFLSSCSIDWNDAKEERIAELTTQVRDIQATIQARQETSTFEKKTRCGTLIPEIEKRISSLKEEYKDIGKMSAGGVFYSPIKDSCLWIRLTSTYAKDGSPMERKSLYVFGEDMGASEPILGCEKILTDKNGANTCEKWDNEIKKLKGEGATESNMIP